MRHAVVRPVARTHRPDAPRQRPRRRRWAACRLALATAWCLAGAAQATVILSSNVNGATAADISSTVNGFRNAIGGANNGGAPTSFASGRREINWDGVPDALADPQLLPGNFFNANLAGRGRGIVFSTPGSGFLVSANAGAGPATAFGFATDFVPFSAQRLFTPLGSVVTDVRFFLPSSPATPATSRAFGSVFQDVESGFTALAFYDATDTLLHQITVASGGSGSMSFAGAVFDASVVSRVRITSGDAALLANGVYGPGVDGVVMDDFVYAEPQSVSELSTASLLAAGGLALLVLARRRGQRE